MHTDTKAFQRTWPWELAAGAALVLLFTWPLAFTNLILARGDTLLYFYPLWDYRAHALIQGRLPLWAPELFMGAPFLANSQTGVLYPLNWPLAFFPAPQAVKIAITAHLIIAGAGAQTFARRALGQSALAAWLAAATFALGGYLLAQVEHVNQLQALAWFPWLLVAAVSADRRRRTAALGGLIALQLLAGHTQSVFVSLTGLGVFQLVIAAPVARSGWPRAWLAGLWPLGLSVVLAVGLAAAQLLPTAELAGESLRSGGLPWREALSFSLDPRLLGRALLPGYSRSLFTEFVAYSGVAGLALAALGLRRTRPALALAALAALGLAFALGAFNPLYAALAAVPPVNLFRVPARWLFLFAFGVAMLAGFGLDRVRAGDWRLEFGLWRSRPLLLAFRPRPSGLGPLALLLPPALMALTPLAAALTPAGETGPLGAPALSDWAGWLAVLAALALILAAPLRAWRAPAALALALAELFAAAQALPIHRLTAPEAYASIRPAMTQLLADRRAPVADRFLSLSALRFDPGDLAELRGILEPQLPPAAVDDFILATKHKEVLSPNLPLAWGAPAVDGFDGGLLPLRHYAAFTALLTGTPSADGRLRENLPAAPDPRLLALVNARWLITDKVGDAWVDGVFYDLQFEVELGEGERSAIRRAPTFEATDVGVVAEAADGRLRLTAADGAVIETPLTDGRVSLSRPFTPARIELIGPARVRGLSLVDVRTGAFQSLTLGPFRLAHSGDVKVYENLAVLPRAFVASRAIWIADEAAARAALADPAFAPEQAVTLNVSDRSAATDIAPATAAPAAVRIEAYAPEHVRLTASGPGYLVLTDAFYPGWSATVDGRPAPLLKADIMFRAVPLSAGAHVVEFRFAPRSVTIGCALSGAGLLIMPGLWFWPQPRPPISKRTACLGRQRHRPGSHPIRVSRGKTLNPQPPDPSHSTAAASRRSIR